MGRQRTISKEHITEVAREMFLKKGIGATEMKDIAIRCEIGRGSLYRYYDSKETLSIEIAMDILIEFYDALYESLYIGENGYERVSNGIHAFIQKMIENPQKIKFLDDFDAFFTKGYKASETSRKFTRLTRELANPFILVLEKGVADGSIRKGLDIQMHGHYILNTLLAMGQRILPRAAVIENDQGYAVELITYAAEQILVNIAQK